MAGGIEGTLGERHREPAVRAVVSGAEQSDRRRSGQETGQRAFTREIQTGRLPLDETVDNLQVFAAAELAEILAEQDDVVPGALELPRHDSRRILEHADDADDRRRIDRLAVGLVVEADVATGDRHVERPARFGNARDRLDELPHDLGPLGVAEVQAVGGADRQRRRRTRRSARPRRRPASRRAADRDSSIVRCRRRTAPARERFP